MITISMVLERIQRTHFSSINRSGVRENTGVEADLHQAASHRSCRSAFVIEQNYTDAWMANAIRYDHRCIRITRSIHTDWFSSETFRKTTRLPSASAFEELDFRSMCSSIGWIVEACVLVVCLGISWTRRLLVRCIDQFSQFSCLFFSLVFPIIHSGSNNHQKSGRRKTLRCFWLRRRLGMRKERKSRVVSVYSYLPTFYSTRRHNNKFRSLPSFSSSSSSSLSSPSSTSSVVVALVRWCDHNCLHRRTSITWRETIVLEDFSLCYSFIALDTGHIQVLFRLRWSTSAHAQRHAHNFRVTYIEHRLGAWPLWFLILLHLSTSIHRDIHLIIIIVRTCWGKQAAFPLEKNIAVWWTWHSNEHKQSDDAFRRASPNSLIITSTLEVTINVAVVSIALGMHRETETSRTSRVEFNRQLLVANGHSSHDFLAMGHCLRLLLDSFRGRRSSVLLWYSHAFNQRWFETGIAYGWNYCVALR